MSSPHLAQRLPWLLRWPEFRWIATIARLVLGSVLVAAGRLKVTDTAGSVRAVQAYRLLTVEVARLVGHGLPLLEIVAGLLLVLGLGTRVAAIVGGVLMIVFIAGIASVWVRGLSIDCGCFGGGGTVASNDTRYLQEVLRDIGLLMCAALLCVRPRTAFGLDGVLWSETQ